MQQCKSNPINGGGGGGGGPDQAMFAACSKCEIEFPIDELDAHEQGCTFIPCSSCFEAFDGIAGNTCPNCLWEACVYNNTNCVCDFVKKNATQEWYESSWNTEGRRTEVGDYLKTSGNPKQFSSVFDFFWSNQVKDFPLHNILKILNHFPEHQQEMMKKHILTLPNRQNNILQTVSVLGKGTVFVYHFFECIVMLRYAF